MTTKDKEQWFDLLSIAEKRKAIDDYNKSIKPIITSTPKGSSKFYELWNTAITETVVTDNVHEINNIVNIYDYHRTSISYLKEKIDYDSILMTGWWVKNSSGISGIIENIIGREIEVFDLRTGNSQIVHIGKLMSYVKTMIFCPLCNRTLDVNSGTDLNGKHVPDDVPINNGDGSIKMLWDLHCGCGNTITHDTSITLLKNALRWWYSLSSDEMNKNKLSTLGYVRPIITVQEILECYNAQFYKGAINSIT